MGSVFVELFVDDFQKAINFYKLLGFKPSIKSDYLVMKKDDDTIRFYKGNKTNYTHPYFGRFPKKTKKGYAVEIVIFVDDVKVLYKKIHKQVKVVQDLEKKRWGAWDFRVEDPFGFYLRITNPDSCNKFPQDKTTFEKLGLKK